MSAKCADPTCLSDTTWERLLPRLRAIRGIKIGSPWECRRFIDAVLWVLRVGGQWRVLPPERGIWNSVFKRFSRWAKLGVWRLLHEGFLEEADLQEVSIDSTIARAHACAAGAARSDAKTEALGRSRGGFGCKIHAVADALGLPVKFILTEGQAADITQGIALLEGIDAKVCLADKGYDAESLLSWLKTRGIKAIIPPKSNRKEQRECDWWHYKERHVIECMFSKLKHYRRIATRYEKKAINFMGMLSLAAVLLWMR